MSSLIPTVGTNPWDVAFKTLWEVAHNDDGTEKSVASIGYDPVTYGAIHNGVTDDSVAIQDAADAATANNGTLYFGTAGTYLNGTGLVELGANTRAVAAPGVTVKGYGFHPATGCEITGFTFLGDQTAKQAIAPRQSVTAQTDIDIHNNVFNNYAQTIYIDRTGDGTVMERINVYDNVFTGCKSGVFAINANACKIANNSFVTAQNNAQAILFWGGSRNRVTGNYIQYGLTGILFLFHRSLNGAAGLMSGNIIANNVVLNCSEEHISFDVNGNTNTDVAVLEQDTVASKASSNTVTLTNAAWAAAGSKYVGYYMCFNTGGIAGQVAKITASSNGTFTLDLTAAQYAAIAASDAVVIGAPTLQNVIANNYVDASARGTTLSIALYGLAYLNTVIGNTVVGKDIRVVGLNSLVKSSPNVTNTFGMGPSESNTIVGNTFRKAGLSVDYLDFASSPSYTQHGNLVGLNQYSGGGLTLSHQDIPAYTVTNPTADRALDVTGDTLPQGLEVLGTLIADLQTRGVIG